MNAEPLQDSTGSGNKTGWKFLGRVLVKALALFILFNLLLVFLPDSVFGRISLYNTVFPGRTRFPFGEDQQRAYNLSLYNINAMFESHVVVQPAAAGEFRIFVLGDSSVWGTLLKPEQTLAGQINAADLQTCDGQQVKAYNLGYPTLSLFKDLMLLEQGMQYQPNLVLWLVTLESLPLENQLSSPIVANNANDAGDLIRRYSLALDIEDPALHKPGFWGRTLIGRRRALANLVRLQTLGVMWAATGIDQAYPDPYVPAQRDLEADLSYYGWMPGDDIRERLTIEILEAGERAAGEVPVWFINEPILISEGENSDIRYNFYYPRWAYDAYRSLLAAEMERNGSFYLDLWNTIPQEAFTNSAIHLSPEGSERLADEIIDNLKQVLCIE